MKLQIDIRLVYEVEGEIMPESPADVVLEFIETWGAGIEHARGAARFSLEKSEVLNATETD